ncbi:MAG: YlxR family protein [Clostridia bacterium]|nr:YlxR family protein [Clostridia bacterium]
MRMCNGCGEMVAKNQLIRIVRDTEGELSLDLTGKKNGRGAYLCRNVECLKKARKNHRIDRSLQMQIPDEIYDRLEKEFACE